MPDISFKALLAVPLRYATIFPFPQETSRMVEIRAFGEAANEPCKLATPWIRYAEALRGSSLDPLASEYGTVRRPYGLMDLYALGSVSGKLAHENKDELIKHNTNVAYEIASDALNTQGENVRAKGVIGNPSFLAHYLVMAGFLALDEPDKARKIFEAALATGTRALRLAIYVGTFALLIKGKPNWLPYNMLKQALKKTTTCHNRLKETSLRSYSARLTYLKIAWKAAWSHTRYGLNNFQNAISDFYDEKLKNHYQGVEDQERWADKAHNEFMEIWACCSSRGLWGALRFYVGTAIKLKEAHTFAAWMANICMLTFLFRTACQSLQEALIVSFTLENESDGLVCSKYVKDSQWKKQVAAWQQAYRLEQAMVAQDFDAIKELNEIEMVGEMRVHQEIKEHNSWYFYKRLMENMIVKHSSNAEMVYRYAYVLSKLEDEDAKKWQDRLKWLAPKRHENF